MHENKEIYISPFSTRYASKEMQEVFSEQFKFRTWRRLWIALARAEKALGLDITDEGFQRRRQLRSGGRKRTYRSP